MVFQGNLVGLRPLEKADLHSLVEWSNDPEVDVYMDGGYPRTIDDATKWLKESNRDRHVRRFAIETLSGRLIGDLSFDQIAWRSGDAELTIRIGDKGFWGKGYGTEAVNIALTVAFEHLGLGRVYLRVYRFNERALRAYRKCGFKREGVLRRNSRDSSDWKEIILMSKACGAHQYPLVCPNVMFA